MIFGSCPYPDCECDFTIPLHNGTPIERQVCDNCKRVFWTFHSRFDPKSWTDEEFRTVANVDDEAHTIAFKDKDRSIYSY